ncbi:MAG: S-layer protein [Candidatus Micrarchaeota archaeon]
MAQAMEPQNATLVLGTQSVEARIVGEKAMGALSSERLRILVELSRADQYPAELARSLGMGVQTAYYHMRILAQAGLVELASYQAAGGAMAKKYRCSAGAVALLLRPKWKPLAREPLGKPPEFFRPLISAGRLDAKIIVGSPDPHGKYRSRGSEYCTMELASILGAYASFRYPLYFLDTEAKESSLAENLIVVGGPKVNMVAEKANSALPIRFSEKGLGLHSTLSNKRYSENFGIIELVDSPFAKGKKMLFIAGSDHMGTRAAVLAMITEREKLEKGNMYDAKVLAKVVQGFDEDGDGIVDAVEILE